MIRLGFGPVSNTAHESAVGPEQFWKSLNLDPQRRACEAWPGFWESWRPTLPQGGTASRCHGMAFGRYGDDEETLVFVEESWISGQTRVYTIINGVTYAHTAGSWTGHDVPEGQPIPWAQYGQYIYFIIQQELWRKKIGDVTEGSLRRAPTVLESITTPDGAATLERPNPGYPIGQWGSGDWAGALSTVCEGFTSYAPAAVGISGGVLQLSQTGATESTERLMQPWFVVNFTAPINLLEHRYLYMEARVEEEEIPANNRLHEAVWIDLNNTASVYVTDDNGAAAGGSWTNWIQGRAYMRPITPSLRVDGRYVTVGIWIDLDHTHGATNATILDAIEQIAIRVPVGSGDKYSVSLGSPYIGGTFLNKPNYASYMDGGSLRNLDPLLDYSADLEDIEYAICTYDTVGLTRSAATITRIAAKHGVGVPFISQSGYLGSGIRIEYDAPPSGSERTEILRRRRSDGDDWYILVRDTAAGVLVDYRVDAANDPLDWNEVAILSHDYDFGTAAAALLPDTLERWKGHLCLGVGPEVYVSFYESPDKFLQPLRNTPKGSIDTEDPTLGATSYMADDLSDQVMSIVAADPLYAFGKQGAYYSIGDDARTSTPFRRLPGTFGCFGFGSACRFAGGVAVATTMGVFYYRVTRAAVESSDTDVQDFELTAGITDAYFDLLTKGAPHPVLVCEHRGELWVARGQYVLRRSRPDDGATWAPLYFTGDALTSGNLGGQTKGGYGLVTDFPDAGYEYWTAVEVGESRDLSGFQISPAAAGTDWSTPAICGLHSDPVLGLRFVSHTGKLFRIGTDADGTVYKSHAGYAIPWAGFWGSFHLDERSRLQAAEIRAINMDMANDPGPIRMGVEVYDGGLGSKGMTWDHPVEFTGTAGKHNVHNGTTAAGFEARVWVAGRTGAAVVTKVAIDLTDLGEGGDN